MAKKNFLSYFLVSDEDNSDQKQSQETASVNVKKPEEKNQRAETSVPVNQPAPVKQPQFVDAARIDDQMIASLLETLEENDLPGFDYLEFYKSLKAQDNTDIPEKLKFQTVFATAGVLGLTYEKLNESINHYLQKLLEKEADFKSMVDRQLQDKVVLKQTEFQNIQKKEEELIKKIEVINKELEGYKTRKAEIRNEITEQEKKIENVKNNFFAALKHLQTKISEDRDKINTYLKK